MSRLTYLVGLAAAMAWLVLSVLTVGGALVYQRAIIINATLAVVFLGVAALLLWRAKAVDAACRSAAMNKAFRSLLRVEVVTAAGMLLVGLMLVSGAASRVFGEGVPIFG